jgi:BirA family transcriptional regulator, biotin operon repressor / biotin---[acetyl-CoA-carboxylase] ligase
MTDSPMQDIKIGVITSSWAEMHNIACKYIPQITSTNDIAKEEAFDDLPAVQLYVTDDQTSGRGRGTNTWITPPAGTSLLSSWSFHSAVAPSPYITALIGLGLFHAAHATWPFLNWNLKAPNDLYIDAKKIAGLLVETVSQGSKHRIVVGLGFNVFAHPQLEIATDLLSEATKLHAGVMGADWIKFLDRVLFEICAIIPEAHEEPDATTQLALISVLNLHPKLDKKYSHFNQVKEALWR